MSDVGGVIVLVALAAWCISRRARQAEKSCAMTQSVTFPVAIQKDTNSELQEVIRKIQEEVDVMNRTKDPETGVKCFAAIRRGLTQLATEAPSRIRISMILGERELCSELEVGGPDAEEHFKILEKDWVRGFFSEKIDTFMKQSEGTQDPVLRTEHLRDALRTVHKGLEYLPEDSELLAKADFIEQKLSLLKTEWQVTEDDRGAVICRKNKVARGQP